MVVDVFNYYAGAPERLLGNTIPVAGGVDMTFREPLGVVALIVPWNLPIAITSWKVGPALAAGNTIVLKPAGLTPLTALELERLALQAGIPEGVLNVVVGAARADDHVEHALGDAGLQGQALEFQRGQRREACGLQDDGVARGQRRSDLPRCDRDRQVPRHDQRHHSQRLPERHVDTAGDGDGVAEQPL